MFKVVSIETWGLYSSPCFLFVSSLLSLFSLSLRCFCLSHTHTHISDISFPMHPAKWQSEWGSLKSAAIWGAERGEKMFCIIYIFYCTSECARCTLCPPSFTLLLFCLCSFSFLLSLSLSFRTSVIRARCVRRACFGFSVLSLRFLSLNLLLSLTNCQVCQRQRQRQRQRRRQRRQQRCSYSSWFA